MWLFIIKREVIVIEKTISKSIVYDMYFSKQMSVLEIAKANNCTKQNICYILKQNIAYEEEKQKRFNEEKQKINEKKEKIQMMYYDLKLKNFEIAEKLEVSIATVTRAIKSDERYCEEKENRKALNKEKNKNKIKKQLRDKNNLNSYEEQFIISNLMKLQNQNARSMSRQSKISDSEIINMNLQHYEYDDVKERLIFNENIAGCRPSDLPKSKKVHEFNKYNNKLYNESSEDAYFKKY